MKENEKARTLEQELAQMGDEQRIIVFANTKRQVWVWSHWPSAGRRADWRAGWWVGGGLDL